MATKYEKVCPRCGRKWSTSFAQCQKCPGVALEVRDMAGNLLKDAQKPKQPDPTDYSCDPCVP